ncbi:NEDD8-conjugating enzyme Ubc12 [Citrus sinensis]|uniref:NEDD8-conjugating enzyme Ubc12 n=1 Tax=Citrus sinensis TaxID=2711 RepID=A0ACB8IG25_CITSI|nr:NEDD8-conjugating enzyme Ubc12 [Citrus sinensis]
MIKLFKVKEKQRENAENANGKTPVKKQSAGELRLHRDISELNLPKTCSITFPNGKDDLMNFEVSIRPDEGYYVGGTFVFTFQVSPIYPHEAPKVKCKTKVTRQTLFAHSLFAYLLYFLPTLLHGCSVYLLIFFLANTIACILTCALHLQVYHPNIDLEGNVCLNILREDWKPVLNINTIIYGLFHLFTQPNYEDPLNHEAAAVLRDNPKLFESNVRRAMAGGYVGQTFFIRCI